MYRLLLPGLRIKRWILVGLAGMVMFAYGFSLLSDPFLLRERMWQFWLRFTDHLMPERVYARVGLVLALIGVVAVIYGTRRLIRAFTSLANPDFSREQLMQALMDRHYPRPMPRIVGIGGGTGQSNLLRGLKAYPVDLTAIVTVSDDGGSSGRLRSDLDMPPPGDIRNCLVALADTEPLMERLFQFRFSNVSRDLEGHNLGNLIIAGLQEMSGDFNRAIKEASRVLAIHGRVLPSANCAIRLRAEMEDGSLVEGETAITAHRGVIKNISLDPPDVEPLPEVLEAIQQADVIIVGPGSVYSSLVPNLIIPGMAEALAHSPAIKIFVCNVMTQPGESDHFSASRHLEAVLQHLPCKNPFHYAIVNKQRPPQDVIALYAKNGQSFVEPDLERFRTLGTIPVTADLLAVVHLARHDPAKLAYCILERVALDTNLPGMLRRRT